MCTTQQWSPSGIQHRCDLDLIKKKKKEKRNFLPRVNNAKAVQVHFLFVCDFWQQGNFRNANEQEK